MDPITGIGLAASVIQLVSFSIGAAKTCREIYEHGISDDHCHVDYVASHLASLTVSIEQSLQNPTTQSLRLSKEERELVTLSRACQNCGRQLQQEIQHLKTPRTSIVLAASKAARALWKKNRIEQIQKQLESYRSTLEISLLSRLSQRFDAQALASGESFASLDKNLQHIIACLAKSETTLATISVQEAEKTRQHTAAQIGHLKRLYVDDRRFEEVTRSLFYPEIFSRQEQIANVFDGIESSYDWIFDKPRTRKVDTSNQTIPHTAVPLWDDFTSWLRSGHGVYWINGKAGSGKSTLMNYICSHSRRLELLQEWRSDRRLLTPSFFFWNSGSRQQKTIDGLLRSLIYQILTDCRQLITCFKDTIIHAWTESRLLTFLFSLLRQTQVDVAICMFIDGLDEFDGPYDSVIRMITDLSDQRHVKICVSSRPLLAFQRAFEGEPGLKLQDLTFDSIQEYTEKQLSHLVQQYAFSNEKAQRRAERLIRMIVQRAAGVFLWAVIATREARDGLQGMADLNELEQAIEVLPPELADLFMLVLKRIKPAFRRDAAKFLQIVLLTYDKGDFDLSRLQLISSQQEFQDAPFVYEDVAMSELTEACRALQTRLLSHTASFLELTPSIKGNSPYCKREDWDPISFTRVDFVHRTVREFLTDNNEAKSFMSDHGLSEEQVHLCIVRGTLAHLIQHSQGDPMSPVRWANSMIRPLKYAFRHVSTAERLSGSAQSKLIQSLDFADLARGYTIIKVGFDDYDRYREAFWREWTGTLVDVVGMAAAEGMTIYVCEELGLSASSAGYHPSLPDLEKYSTSRAASATLFWDLRYHLPDSGRHGNALFRRPIYRQALSKCMQWEDDTPANLRPDEQTVIHPLAESYILCCCEPITTPIDLLRILLKEGANPMVRVRVMGNDVGIASSFWARWLEFLRELRHTYMAANGKSGGVLFGKEHLDGRLTLSDVFDVTKALLAHGADINHQMEDKSSCFPNRSGLFHKADNFIGYGLEFSPSAMFILEECFKKEPEFQEFAVAVRPIVKTPTRRIVEITGPQNLKNPNPNVLLKLRLSSADGSELWPMYEKWEISGHQQDRVPLLTAIKQKFEAYNRGYNTKERATEIYQIFRSFIPSSDEELEVEA